MEGRKMTFGRAVKWIVCAVLIGAILGGAFGFGYTMSKGGGAVSNQQAEPYSLADGA